MKKGKTNPQKKPVSDLELSLMHVAEKMQAISNAQVDAERMLLDILHKLREE